MTTLHNKQYFILIVLSLISIQASAIINYKQTIRGKIIDEDSRMGIIGASVYIPGTDPILGASTDVDGNFRIENVPVGRVNLQVSSLGYESKSIPNLVVGSSKEVVLNIEIQESVVSLQDITVKGNGKREEVLNEMALVSAKAFTVEETSRYAGSLNDPARMVSGFAGVTGDPSGNNDIVVRGNSPKGILWRLEGIEIPNPNHFADEGRTGGPINALNSTMLSNSDFFSGAFSPEYGNAYSGVFDMKLRNGNNEKSEYSASLGVLGIEATAEGPFKKGYNGSYLINYRYSSLDILDQLNIVDFGGIPKYQDMSFKFLLPTNNLGTFSLFGLGGISSILDEDEDEANPNIIKSRADYGADLGTVGLNHLYQINDKTFIKTYTSVSGTKSHVDEDELNPNDDLQFRIRTDFTKTYIKTGTCFSSKLSARHRVKAGVSYNRMGYTMFAEEDDNLDGLREPLIDVDGNSGLIQGYLNWKYRIGSNLTMVSGLHYMQLQLNNNQSIEPRLGLKYQLTPKQNLSLGFGIHSKVESIVTYYAMVEGKDGSYSAPNKDLGLAKASHLVLGYGHRINENLHFKIEAYYQHLYDVVVENDPTSGYVLNNRYDGYTDKALTNGGTGRNYGLELTFERFYNKGFYYLFTGSLYESKYTALDNIERDSRFNGNYAANLLIGKEFKLGDPTKNRTLSVNTKFSLLGGQRFTPIDLEASRLHNDTKYHEDQLYGLKGDDIFQMNLGIAYRRDRKKTTHEFKIDIQNVTNNQAVVYEKFSEKTQNIKYEYQLPMLPNLIYTVYF